MAVEGVIAEATRGLLPVTWDALSRDTGGAAGASRYGDDLLRSVVDTAKEMVTGTVVIPSVEESYSYFVRDYIAKVAALNLIPAGIDFWMSEPISESATGTNENHTFTDRALALRELAKMLAAYVRDKEDEVATALGFTRGSSRSIPLSSTQDDPFITPSHQEFGRPYVETAFT